MTELVVLDLANGLKGTVPLLTKCRNRGDWNGHH